MSSECVLSVQGISKCFEMYEQPRDRLMQFLAGGRRQYFRELWALRDISFELARGESVGLIGQNGSGKSTLLQIVTGTLSPTTGAVRSEGRVAALLELGAGFNPEFTGRENVYMNAAIMGVSRQQMAERMQKVLDFSELADFIDQPVKTYSSGMYARLAFSAAIHVDPDVLIVDETLAVGDARFVAKCMRRIQDLKKQGTSILFVSHDVTAVRTLCQRAVWIDKGRLVEDGDVFPVTGRYTEFMFRDESVASNAPGGGANALPSEGIATPAAPVPVGAPTAGGNVIAEARPVTHWGSHKGVILAAFLRDAESVQRDVYSWGEPLEVVVRVRLPADIPREQLSVAISIKDLRGTDLMVSTTHDVVPREFPASTDVEIRFRFRNALAPGKYLLVAAVEKRRGSTDIHYYEYIEGAHYFASTSEWMMFGMFHPEVEQSIETCAFL
ncbi:MAG: transporter ATP-binding protein [Rhodoferax sp.]|nr:transporter ATP-binding protein [Rhodoferax sp.]